MKMVQRKRKKLDRPAEAGWGGQTLRGGVKVMLKKKCPECGANSYSSTQKGKWTCPECKADLTNEKARGLNEKEKENRDG